MSFCNELTENFRKCRFIFFSLYLMFFPVPVSTSTCKKQRFETIPVRIPLRFMSILKVGKILHSIQKEEKELVKLESSLCENYKAGRQTGEGESRDKEKGTQGAEESKSP